MFRGCGRDRLCDGKYLKAVQRLDGDPRRPGRAWRRASPDGMDGNRRSDCAPQHFRRHRFPEEVHGPEFHGVYGELDRRVGRDHDHARVGRALPDQPQRLQTIETGHLLIEDDGVVWAAVTQAGKARFAVARLVHVIAGAFECQTHHLPDMRLIVDDQHFHGCASCAGRTVNVKMEPCPGDDWTVSWPPCASTIRREMVRPRPAPPPVALGTWTNGSKIRDSDSCGMPVPVSATEITISGPRCAAVTVMAPPADVARIALVTRLVMTRSIWLRSTETAGRSGGASTCRRMPRDSTCRRSGSIAPLMSADGRIGASTGVTAPDSIFDRSRSSRISRSSRAVSSRQTSKISCCRSPSWPVAPSSNRWIPICTLVNGVRNSWDAAAMNSDLSRLISLRCVMSSSSVTAPTSLPSASFIGVERIRNARRAPSTAHGNTAAALSDATGTCERSTSRTA